MHPKCEFSAFYSLPQATSGETLVCFKPSLAHCGTFGDITQYVKLLLVM